MPARSMYGLPVPGLEARFNVINGPTFNDNVPGEPGHFLRAIGGWRSTADLEAATEKTSGREGESPRFSQRSGKTITFEGATEGYTKDMLRYAADDLLSWLWDPTYEREIQVEVLDAGVWTPVYKFYARPISVDGPEQQVFSPNRHTGGWERNFVITWRMSDARLYAVNQEVHVISDPAGANVGSIIPPVTPPITIPSSTAGQAEASVLNVGLAPADPLIQIWGRVDNPTVRNLDIPAELSFPGLSIASASYLEIDFKKRTVLLEGQSNYKKFKSGDWWNRGIPGLLPETQSTLRLEGDNMDATARIEVFFDPARY